MKPRQRVKKRKIDQRSAGAPRLNLSQLATIASLGEIAPPQQGKSPYRIDRNGMPRLLPGPGGIVLSHRVGDPCVGLAADHLEPGVSIQSRQKSLKGTDGPNLALNSYACIGNRAVVVSGPCAGQQGVVTGKHGGVNHVLLDFPKKVLLKLRIGDRVQVYTYGLGLRMLDHPNLTVVNAAPKLLQRWGLRSAPPKLFVPVTHRIPAGLMASGLGRDNTVRGDYDIQLSDPESLRRFGLGRLRFGDLVAIRQADNRFGRSRHGDFTSVGVVVHGDSVKAGHGPGVVTLISGESRYLELLHDSQANLARVLGIRSLPKAQNRRPFAQRHGGAFQLANGAGVAI
ncbi:MAG: DUF4438 domain-containing protein [Chromatiales bacterium]|nr:DUF4438 domain-containing protein [Chromatiales bacterium]